MSVPVSPVSGPTVGSNLKEMFIKGGLVGLAGGLGSIVLFNETSTISLGGMSLPAWAVVAGATGVSSAVADLAKDYILPHIPQNQKFSHIEGVALGLGSAGLSSCLLLRLAGAPEKNMLKCIGLGAGSYILGDFAYKNIVDRATGGILF